jgi:hypothetical protein
MGIESAMNDADIVDLLKSLPGVVDVAPTPHNQSDTTRRFNVVVANAGSVEIIALAEQTVESRRFRQIVSLALIRYSESVEPRATVIDVRRY